MKKQLQSIFILLSICQVSVAQTYTTLLKDINPGAGDAITSSIANFYTLNNTLIFLADDGNTEYGQEWWISDGTAVGTTILKDIMPGTEDAEIKRSIQLGDLVLFFADDGIHGNELWRTDGTSEGTFLLKDINPEGSSLNFEQPFNDVYEIIDGTLYFIADRSGEEAELWKTDGTEAGTQFIMDPNGSNSNAGRVENLIEHEGELYFWSDGLWQSDGTEVGTMKILDYPTINFVHDFMYSSGGLIYMVQGISNETEVYVTDGTEEGSFEILDIDFPGSESSQPRNFFFFEGLTWFTAGGVLYITDGTIEGTQAVEAVSNLDVGDQKNAIFLFNNRLTIIGHDEELERIGFYQKNGDSFEFMAETTESVYNARLWTPLVIGEDGLLYFDGWTEEHGGGLYSSDGQSGVQTFLGDPAQTLPYDVGSLTFVGDKLFHYADPEDIGRELHVVSTAMTSVSDIQSDFVVKYYPNPATEDVSIEGDFLSDLKFVSITDLSGKIYTPSYQSTNNQLVINLPDNLSGLSFINLRLSDGSIQTIKIIK